MKFRPEIEGLRAIAVSLVVLSHFHFSNFSGGYIGVDVFFVLSGFLITSLICHEYLENVAKLEYRMVFSLRNFYIRRAKRIIPLSVFVLVVVVFASKIVFNPERIQPITTDAIWASIFMANLHFINNATNYFANDGLVSPLQHFWTLSVEEQFYFFFPSIIFFRLRNPRRYLLGRKMHWKGQVLLFAIPFFLVSFSYSLIKTFDNPTVSYFSSLTRAWELTLGVILAVITTKQRKFLKPKVASMLAIIGIIAILGSAVFFNEATRIPGVAALLPTFGASGIILGTKNDNNHVAKLLSGKILTFLGRISYSIYLWHWPILVFVSAKYPSFLYSSTSKIITIAFVIILSYISYISIEKPFRNMSLPNLKMSKRNIRILKKTLPYALFVMSSMALIGLSTLGKPISPYEPKSGNFTIESQNSLKESPTNIDTNTIGNSIEKSVALDSQWRKLLVQAAAIKRVPKDMNPGLGNLQNNSEYWRNCFATSNTVPCSYGNSTADSSKTAIVYGDSYAISILPTILGSLDLSKWKVDVLTHAQCMIAEVTEVSNDAEVAGCNSFRSWSRKYILEHQHSILFLADNPDNPIQGITGGIIYTPGTSMNPYWVKQFRYSVARLAMPSQLMVIIGPPPQPEQSLRQCVNNSMEISLKCFAKVQSKMGPRRLAKSIALSNSGIFIDLQEPLCVNGRCPPIIDGTPVFFDNSHFTFEFSIKLVPYLRGQLYRNSSFTKLQ